MLRSSFDGRALQVEQHAATSFTFAIHRRVERRTHAVTRCSSSWCGEGERARWFMSTRLTAYPRNVPARATLGKRLRKPNRVSSNHRARSSSSAKISLTVGSTAIHLTTPPVCASDSGRLRVRQNTALLPAAPSTTLDDDFSLLAPRRGEPNRRIVSTDLTARRSNREREKKISVTHPIAPLRRRGVGRSSGLFVECAASGSRACAAPPARAAARASPYLGMCSRRAG